MEMAKLTSKGQITIPISIRKRLSLSEGDKILFINSPDGVVMVNPDLLPGGEAQVSVPVQKKEKDEHKTQKQGDAIAPARGKSQEDSGLNTSIGHTAIEQKKHAHTEEPDAPNHGLDLHALLNEIRSIGTNSNK